MNFAKYIIVYIYKITKFKHLTKTVYYQSRCSLIFFQCDVGFLYEADGKS